MYVMFQFNVGQKLIYSSLMIGAICFSICKGTSYSLVQRQRRDGVSVSHATEWFLTYRDCFIKKILYLDILSFILSTSNHKLYFVIVKIFFVTRVSKFSD